MPIESNGKTAYIYSNGNWYPIAGSINTSQNYNWTGEHTFASEVTFNDVLNAKAGINNFQNFTERDSVLSSPTNGIVCFVRQDNDGGLYNQLQYYYNGVWKNVYGYSLILPKLGSYTVTEKDAGKIITVSSSSSSVITLPANSTEVISSGYKIEVIRLGTGSVQVTGESGVTINAKGTSGALIDSQYGKITVLKTDTNTWVAYGDISEGSSSPSPAPTPAPVSPSPVSPSPVAPSPVAPSPTPTPVPAPIAPSPVSPVAPVVPVAPSPIAPSPAPSPSPSPAPSPAAPAPISPAPVAPQYTNYYGYCDLSNNPVGPFGPYDYSCEQLYATQESANGYPPIGWACGPTPTAGTPSCTVTPAPVAPSPAAPSPAAPAPVSSCNPADAWSYTQGMCQACGYYWSSTFGECSTTPWAPVTPAPVAPSPVAPAPAAPSPASSCNSADAWSYTQSMCQACGYYWSSTFGECSTTPWAPVAPSPAAPSPAAPSPAPSPAAPSPAPVSSCNPANAWSYNQSTCQACGYYWSSTFGECSTTPWTPSPSPVAPSPVAPSPASPSPVAPSPVAPSPVAPVAPSPASPSPVAPSPVAPSPVAPSPVAPSPVAPSPVAPSPVAPSPVASCNCETQGCTTTCCIPCGGMMSGGSCVFC